MIGITQDLIIILAIAAFIFGAKRLPEIGKGLGKGIQEFKSGLTGLVDGDGKTHSSQSEEAHNDIKTGKAIDGSK